MARLVFSGMLDKLPNLKVLAHHLGAMVPYFEGRVGPGWDQLGKRTSDEDYITLLKNMKKRPLDYFKNDFYVDTAVFGSKAATVCGFEFYPDRQDPVRLRLPVRSRARPGLHPRHHRHHGVLWPAQGRHGEDLLQERREALEAREQVAGRRRLSLGRRCRIAGLGIRVALKPPGTCRRRR